GERYGEPGARFETETPTAVAGVHGTGFVARYDPKAEESVFVGLFHVTCVRASGDPGAKHEVCIGPGQMTRVPRDALPTPRARAPGALREELAPAPPVGPPGGPIPGAAPAVTSGATPGPAPRDGLATPPQSRVDQPIPVIEKESKPPPPPPPLPQQPR